MKKCYHKPELKTRILELGVFGDYQNGRRETTLPAPIPVIENLNTHME